MERPRITAARAIAATLAFVTASYHLFWGLPRSLLYLQAFGALADRGLPPDPRPFLFVAFAAVVLVGPYLVTREKVSLRRAYQVGAVLMVLSFLSWAAWHETGHGAALTGLQAPDTGHGHSHGGTVLHTVVDHYAVEPVEGLIKTVELTAAALFALLLRYDPAARNGSGGVADPDDAGRTTGTAPDGDHDV